MSDGNGSVPGPTPGEDARDDADARAASAVVQGTRAATEIKGRLAETLKDLEQLREKINAKAAEIEEPLTGLRYGGPIPDPGPLRGVEPGNFTLGVPEEKKPLLARSAIRGAIFGTLLAIVAAYKAGFSPEAIHHGLDLVLDVWFGAMVGVGAAGPSFKARVVALLALALVLTGGLVACAKPIIPQPPAPRPPIVDPVKPNPAPTPGTENLLEGPVDRANVVPATKFAVVVAGMTPDAVRAAIGLPLGRTTVGDKPHVRVVWVYRVTLPTREGRGEVRWVEGGSVVDDAEPW